MTDAILPPKRWNDWALVGDATATAPAQVYVEDADPSPTIYGPDGRVIKVVRTKHPFGFNRSPS